MSLPGSLFILEGPDGVGKTTLVQLLRDRLLAQGLDCVTASFPGREPGTIGHHIYRLHHDPTAFGISAPTPTTLQLLHVVAHVDTIERTIRPALGRGCIVLLDRYWWSTFVYGIAAGLPLKTINAILRPEIHSWGHVVPSAAFLIERSAANSALGESYRDIARRQKTAHPVHVIRNDGFLEHAVDTIGRKISAALRPISGDSTLPPPAAETRQTATAPLSMKLDGRVAPEGFVRHAPTPRFPVYDTYWRFAATRQEIFFKRLRGQGPPWTKDPTLQRHKFTNVYRVCDRVSQFLVRHVIRHGDQSPEEVFFRTLLFKLFNRIETWNHLQTEVGPARWADYNFERYDMVLSRAMDRGTPIYSAAYIMPSARLGSKRKHSNHLRLLERMMKEDLPSRLSETRKMGEAFALLRAYPSIGDFLAYQYVTDLNYSDFVNFTEREFVVAGPGAKDGIYKCFADLGGWSEEDVIKWMTERQDDELRRLSLPFEKLGNRELQYIDCQNIFCEVSKYTRAVHPEALGLSGRTRIKQSFKPSTEQIHYTFPKKWSIDDLQTVTPRCAGTAQTGLPWSTGGQTSQSTAAPSTPQG